MRSWPLNIGFSRKSNILKVLKTINIFQINHMLSSNNLTFIRLSLQKKKKPTIANSKKNDPVS